MKQYKITTKDERLFTTKATTEYKAKKQIYKDFKIKPDEINSLIEISIMK